VAALPLDHAGQKLSRQKHGTDEIHRDHFFDFLSRALLTLMERIFDMIAQGEMRELKLDERKMLRLVVEMVVKAIASGGVTASDRGT
jgi:hypothetical protein